MTKSSEHDSLPRRRRAAAPESELIRGDELHPSYLLWQVSHHSFHILDEVLAPLQLRARPYAFMLVLRTHGSISQQELAVKVGIDPSTVVAIMDSMERAGLAERRRNPDDRRAYRLHLTAHGEKMLAKAEEHLSAYETRLLHPLTEKERKTLVRLLAKLLQAT